MTTPRVKCYYCGYVGEYGIDIIKERDNKFICETCGQDGLKELVAEKLKMIKNEKEVKNGKRN